MKISFTQLAKQFVTLFVALGAVVLVASLASAQTWTGPTTAPPGGNVPAPINVGPDSQTKEGSLIVGVGSDSVVITNGGVAANVFCLGLDCITEWGDIGPYISGGGGPSEGGGESAGSWYQVDGRQCSSYCTSQGLKSKFDIYSGGMCASGEARAPSGSGISYPNGTFGSGAETVPGSYQTRGGQYCYRQGQKADNDQGDRTVGCFCGS